MNFVDRVLHNLFSLQMPPESTLLWMVPVVSVAMTGLMVLLRVKHPELSVGQRQTVLIGAAAFLAVAVAVVTALP